MVLIQFESHLWMAVELAHHNQCVRLYGHSDCQAKCQGGELIKGAQPVFLHHSVVRLGDIEVRLDG